MAGKMDGGNGFLRMFKVAHETQGMGIHKGVIPGNFPSGIYEF